MKQPRSYGYNAEEIDTDFANEGPNITEDEDSITEEEIHIEVDETPTTETMDRVMEMDII